MRVHGAAAVVAALFLGSSMFGHNVALRLFLLGTGIVLASVVVARKEPVHVLPPIWLPFLLWGMWAALSLAWSLEPERTLKEWRNEVFYTGAALWICYVSAQARDAPRLFLSIVAAAAALVCSIAMYEFSRGWEGYLVGWHGGPGDHSSALLALMPCVVMAAWVFSRRGRLWPAAALWALVAILFASAYTTLNRTIWGALAVEFVIIGFLVLARARGKVAAIAVTLGVVAGCGAMLLNVQAQREALGGTPMQRDHRLELWPQILERIEERPLTGYGFGRGILREALQKKFSTLDEHLWHAHNIFLEALIQGGAPAVVLLLVLLGAIAREGWRLGRNDNEATAACGIALLAVLAGMLARNMTDTLLVRQNALLFWGMSGVLMGMGRRTWRA